MRRILALICALTMMCISVQAEAASKYSSWREVALEMSEVLENANVLYTNKDLEGARDEVNHAYFGYYEKIGFERAVMAHISGNRAAAVEYQFATVKRLILNDEGEVKVKEGLDKLSSMLLEDASKLDGPGDETSSDNGSLSVFIASLLIILREGFEAILIVGAIIAYLKKTGNTEGLKPVYKGAAIAVLASIVMAYILNVMAGAQGQNQEITEGLTMFVAVVVLFYVSNFMMAKADAQAWQGYIKSKVGSSLAKGSMFALAFTAFLAVFREGAEVILFYQALLAGTSQTSMIWGGFIAGCLALVIVYLLIYLLSLKLPLKPFFVGTSLLMYVMCISFIGSGVKELQEGDVISVTLIPYVPTIDILGIYPTAETVIPQLVMLVICTVTIVYAIKGWQKQREKLMAQDTNN
ncbi:MAG: FTR1 family protein [Succinivibrio sp.]